MIIFFIFCYPKNITKFAVSFFFFSSFYNNNVDVQTGSSNKKVFNTSLQDHLDTTGRKISYVIELCVCCLLEKGLYEEGLLRVGCGKYTDF